MEEKEEDLPPEGDINEELSESEDEEIVEVQIHPNDLEVLVSELNTLGTDIDTEISLAPLNTSDPNIDDQIVEPDQEYYQHDHMDHMDQEPEEYFMNNSDPIYAQDDFEDFIPITQIKEEKEVPNLSHDGQDPTLKLHKLDAFLVQKFLTTDRGFLRKRFLNLMIDRQSKAEEAGNLTGPIEYSDGSLMCHLCFRVFKDKKSLKRHTKVLHERGSLAKCDRCDYIAASGGALTTHIQLVHLKLFRYECPKCDQFKHQRRKELAKHLIEEHDIPEEETSKYIKSKLRLKYRGEGQPHHCPHCDYQCDTRFKLKKHQTSKHPDLHIPDPEKTCQHCHMEFFETLQMDRHMCPVRFQAKEAVDNIVPTDGRYLCPGCNEGFDSSLYLMEHYMQDHVKIEVKTEVKSLIKQELTNNVDGAGETIKRKSGKHKPKSIIGQLEELKDGTYLCDQCPFIGGKDDLVWHVKQVHSHRKNICEYCQFSSNSMEILGNHVKRVHEGKPFHFCHLCVIDPYMTHKELGDHMKFSHFEETKAFFCTQPNCEFWSRQGTRMRKHVERVHLKAKNFLCDKCEFRAFIPAELDAHIREKHLKIFKFNCHICHKEEIRMGFPTKKRLYRHIKFAHQVDPAAEDNEDNRELIYNPPPLDISLEDNEMKKSRRGRLKGAKNRLKLDPDTGQLVRTLNKRPRGRGPAKSPSKKRIKKTEEQNNVTVLLEHSAQALWWPGAFPTV